MPLQKQYRIHEVGGCGHYGYVTDNAFGDSPRNALHNFAIEKPQLIEDDRVFLVTCVVNGNGAGVFRVNRSVVHVEEVSV